MRGLPQHLVDVVQCLDLSRGLPARCSVLSVSPPLLRELVLARSERKVRLAGKARRGGGRRVCPAPDDPPGRSANRRRSSAALDVEPDGCPGWPPSGPGRRRELADATLAAYLAELHDQGRGTVSAVDDGGRGVLPGLPRRRASPAGERTGRVLAGYRRTASAAGCQARPVGAADLAAVLATYHRPRPRGRGVESDQGAAASTP